jgi:hypothetical protein
LTGKGKIVAATTALSIALGLTVVPLAAAYKVPVPVGLPGGQPTPPSGGSTVSKSATKVAAVSLAGYTGAELSKLRPKVTLPSTVGAPAPAARSIGSDSAARIEFKSFSCLVRVGKSEIGSGASRKGANSLRINFTNHGRLYLNDHNGDAIRLGVKCTVVPTHGKKSTSTSFVVLDA